MSSPIDQYRRLAREALDPIQNVAWENDGDIEPILAALTAAAVEYLEAEIERRVALKIAELEAKNNA